MRDDSTPPIPAARSRFDSEAALAMNDVPLPVGLTERLQAAVRASSIQPSKDAIRPRLASRWPHRLMLSGSVALVLLAAWNFLGPREATLTEADVRQLVELESNSLPAAPLGTKLVLPAGWQSLPGMELAEQPVIAGDDTLSVPVLPLTFRANRREPRVTGLLLALPESRWPYRVEATSLSYAEVRYTATGTWAVWREGKTIFVCVLRADARVLEALQHAAASGREVS
ncbi:MAG: hypothetical protein AABP62_22005 [Planctomycetota bacterium]